MNAEATTSTTSRRQALKIGGLTVSLAALAAACGEYRGGDDGPGRVGNAPVPTDLPEYEVNDTVLLRTASSLEHTAVAVYEAALELDGAIPSALVPVVERLIEDHRMVASTMEGLTTDAGGTPWTCTNPWLMERLVTPTLELIQSNVVGIVQEDTSMVQVMGEILPIGPTVTTSVGEIELVGSADGAVQGDELMFTRIEGDASSDVMSFANALESLATAAHQELALATTITDARVAHLEAAILEARHASVLAIAIGGAGAYISPQVMGEPVENTPSGQIPQFAIPSTFGQTSQIEIKSGPGDLNAVRKSTVLQTPAANSLVYNELTCDA